MSTHTTDPSTAPDMLDVVPPRPLNKHDFKTLSLASLGGALEFYDFIIFVFYAQIISHLFFPATLDPFWAMLNTYGTFAAGYFARPLGGIVMAHFGDMIGRKKMFALSILLMALPTMAIGLMPTFASIGYAAPILLLLMRILQGIAIGGEVPGAWTFVSEHVPKKRVGFANGLLTCGLSAGILFGAVVALVMEKSFSSEELATWAWRLPFILGGVLGLVTMYLRRWLKETPVFQAMQAKKALSRELPVKTILKQHRSGIVLSALLTWFLTAGVVVILLATPQIMSGQYGIPRETAFTMQSSAIVIEAILCVFTGYIADKVGAGKTLIVGAIALAISSFFFYGSLAGGDLNTIFLTYMLTVAAVGVVGVVPMGMILSFPAAVRFTGVSFSYNVSYAVLGGITLPLIQVLSRYSDLGIAYYILFMCVIALGCGLYMMKKKM
ncbi:MFS transporter [Neisseriaceae bacterium CLB008]